MHQSSATKRAPFTPVEALVLVSGNGEARAALEAQCGPGLWPRRKKRLAAPSTNWDNHLISCGSPGWIRTSDHSINSRMLYR